MAAQSEMGVVDPRPRFANRADPVPCGRAHRDPARSAALRVSKIGLACGISTQRRRLLRPLTEAPRGYLAACNRDLQSKVLAAPRWLQRISVGHPIPTSHNVAQRTDYYRKAVGTGQSPAKKIRDLSRACCRGLH